MPAPTILKIVRSFLWNVVSMNVILWNQDKEIGSYVVKGIALH
jgi:hypothetical protein